MESFNIDLEKIDGLVMRVPFLDVQGAMTVVKESNPFEGVHQSTLSMSLAVAQDLHARLGLILGRGARR